MRKPVEMFGRDYEWAALTRFVTDTQPGAALGVVSGRWRQGKTFLLDAACRAAGGFYFGATETVDAESLRRIGAALTAHVRPASPYHFADWAEAVDALLALGSEQPVPVVIDEFPYLAKANPELPSIIRRRSGRCASSAPPLAPGCCCAAPPCPSWAGCCPGTRHCAAGRDWN